MRFISFDLKGTVGFSQGMAIKEIHQTVMFGRLTAAGQADVEQNIGVRSGTLLCLRTEYKSGDVRVAETVWHDNGCGCEIRFKRLNEGNWQEKKRTRWHDCDFDIEFLTLDESRIRRGLGPLPPANENETVVVVH